MSEEKQQQQTLPEQVQRELEEYARLPDALPIDKLQYILWRLEEGYELHAELKLPVHLTVEKRPTELEGDYSVMITLTYDGWYLTDPITATRSVESLVQVLMHFGITRVSGFAIRAKPELKPLEYEPLEEE